MSALTYDQPPFPLLSANEFAWEGKIMLPAWQGFQSRQGFYCHRDSSVPTDGLLKLRVAAEADDPLSSTPSVEQANALTYLVDCQQEIRNVVLSAFYSKYPQWYLDFADACDEEQLDDLPSKLNAPEDLKNLIGPGIVQPPARITACCNSKSRSTDCSEFIRTLVRVWIVKLTFE